MAEQKLTRADWQEWLKRFDALDRKLRREAWFAADWDTYYDGRFESDSPRIIYLLFRKHWIPGLIQGVPYPALIYFKTRMTHSDLAAGTIRVGLHVETNQQDHAINRAAFLEALMALGGDVMKSWPGYELKPRNFNRPFNTRVRFTAETLIDVVEAEFARLQTLGDDVDAAITQCWAVKK